MNTTTAQLELMRRWLDGEANTEEVAQFEKQLRDDAEFRLDYLRYLNIDSGLAALPKDPVQPDTPAMILVTAPTWRPIAIGTAAALIFGLFCATLTWAIVVPEKSKKSGIEKARVITSILNESFENPTTPFSEGFPSRTDVWGGDQAKIVGSTSNRKPLNGDSILSLQSSPKSNLGYLQQIIDASSLPQARKGEMRVIEVIASFLADQPGARERYTLRVASFKESPEKIGELWEGVTWREMDEITLTFSKTGLSTKEDATGWHPLTTMAEVPADARSIVISLAAGRLDKKDPKTPHYVDDVRAELRIIPFSERLSSKPQ